MKILIVRLTSLGDIVHTYPMLYDIKSNVENCTVDWFVDEAFAPLVEMHPYVDNVITIPLRQWKKNKITLLINFRKWLKTVKRHNYEYIIDSQGLLKSAILAKLFKGTVVGLGKNSIKERLATWFYTHKFDIGDNFLATTKNRLLAARVLNYHINVNQIDFGLHNLHLKPLTLTKQKYVVFFHATSQNIKKYSHTQWLKVATHIINAHNFSIIIPYGNDSEKQESLQLKNLISQHLTKIQNTNNVDSKLQKQALPQVIVPNSKLNYTQVSSLINSAEFILGVDTGLIHLANAFNKPTIAIYVHTDPHKTGLFESKIAKNIGNKNTPPNASEVISIFEQIITQIT